VSRLLFWCFNPNHLFYVLIKHVAFLLRFNWLILQAFHRHPHPPHHHISDHHNVEFFILCSAGAGLVLKQLQYKYY